MQLAADVRVVWGDGVALTTKNIPVFRAGPRISSHFTNITIFVSYATILSRKWPALQAGHLTALQQNNKEISV